MYEIADSTTRFGRFVGFVGFGNLFDKGVQFGEYPAIDLGIGCYYPAIYLVSILSRLCLVSLIWLTIPAVHVRIECKESVGVVERSEELTAYLVHAFRIELEVLPGAGVCQHVPAHGVCSVGFECAERIDCVAQTFGHLIAVLIEHESVGDDVLISDRSFDHGVDGVERKEPSARLVHTFGYEVGSTRRICVLEGIVVLCVRHGSRVEPNIDQVQFAFHRLARRRNKDDSIHVGTMEIDDRRIVVSFAVVAYFVVRPRVRFHETGLHGFLDFIEQFCD